MSKTRPRVVLVGAGGYGRLYVEALTSQDMGAELTAICDIDPNLAERVPQIRQRQIPVYPTLDAFFAKDSADLAVPYRRCISIPIWYFPAWSMA